ncbi:hypothetical protein EYF80_047046 [Liparis tanakae]|uniref:Uncharacterized protein n=1 Tax=Liparis tanakae TaxID=230148 RepID=A0A4Z2FNH0_9TELE|nr:hypothetical protein EYF80_047046 [Liparis tanakae]
MRKASTPRMLRSENLQDEVAERPVEVSKMSHKMPLTRQQYVAALLALVQPHSWGSVLSPSAIWRDEEEGGI